jgi:hypothetical protein
MDTGLTPTTELEAVNQMMLAVAESPVNALDDDQSSDAGEALQFLRVESKALQTKGWYFNTDEEFPLSKADDGTVPLPANTLSFLPSGPDKGSKLTYRAGKVYDRYNNTFTIDRTVYADIVTLLPFEDMPEAARRYVMVCAARKFQDRRLGDGQLHTFHAQDELSAWASFIEREAQDEDHNVVRDSTTVRAILGRFR